MKRYSFNDGWKYQKEGGSWREISLPHDAMILEERRINAPSGSAQAFFPGGSYVYEKTFSLPNEWVGQPVKLQFEGVYKNAQVFVNGEKKGGAAYGYIPFWVDCGILPSGENVIQVTCENIKQPDSRWYSGAGIYRPVWAWVGNGVTEEDIRITTLSIQPTKIEIEINTDREKKVEILDDEIIASGTGNRVQFEIPQAHLWSDDHPYLYTCRVEDVEVQFGIRQITWSSKGLFVNGKETLLRGGCVHHDNGILGAVSYRESEFRKVRILKENGYNAIRSSHNPCSRAMLDACDYYGMYLIDETWDMWYHHKNPHDYAGQWREHFREDIRSMARRDYNHPSVILYSIGNEVSEPAQEEGVKAIREMVANLNKMDGTRPVSAGFNLMIIANAKKGKGIYDDEKGGRKNDSDKSFGGMNSTMFNLITSMVGTGMNQAANSAAADAVTTPALDAVDIAGYNYASGRYKKDGKLHPERIIYGSETFPQDIAKNWEMVKKYPYLIGDFMWTAWDYLGEAGIGSWAYTPDGKGFNKPYPWLLADVGALDILGNPNGEVFHAAAVWNQLKTPAIAVRPVNHPGVTPAKGSWRGTNAIPSWSWHGCEGNNAIVELYFNCTKMTLLLNGRRLGEKRVKDCRCIFKTKYKPGRLEAVAYDSSGKEVARSCLKSAKDPDVNLWLENTMPAASEERQSQQKVVRAGEIFYLPVVIADAEGNVESNSDEKLHVSVENGKLLAFGSANPRTDESYHEGIFTTWYGRSLAIVRAGKPGKMIVKVCNDSGRKHRQIELSIK